MESADVYNFARYRLSLNGKKMDGHPCDSCGFQGIRKGICSEFGCAAIVCNSERHNCRYYCSYRMIRARHGGYSWREAAEAKTKLFCPKCYFAHHRCATCKSSKNCQCCYNKSLDKCWACHRPLCSECSISRGCACNKSRSI